MTAYENLDCTDFKKAIEYHERLLKVAKEVGSRYGEGLAYGNLANAYHNLGDFKTAIAYYDRYLKFAKEAGDRAGEGRTYDNIGKACQGLGDFKKAIDYHERCLKIDKEIGDRSSEQSTYGNLGNAYRNLGDFKKAMFYHELCLKISREVKDRSGEGRAYGRLGKTYYCLGDFKNAIDHFESCLEIFKEVGDKSEEGKAFGSLGNVYCSLGDVAKAVECQERCLTIAKEVKDRSQEGSAYSSLGNAYFTSGDLQNSVVYHELHLKIAKEEGNRSGEGVAYGNLGNAYCRLGNFKKAIVYYEFYLKTAKEVEDRAKEGQAYGKLGYAYGTLRELKKAIEYQKLQLKIAKQVGDMYEEGSAYANLGLCFELLGSLHDALACYQSSVRVLNDVRARLQSKDELKISLRDMLQNPYTALWRVLLELDRSDEALYALDKGRSQALNDIMESKYGIPTADTRSGTGDETIHDLLTGIQCSTIFLAVNEKPGVINFWVIKNGTDVCKRVKDVGTRVSDYVKDLVKCTFEDIGVGSMVECEDRSLNKVRKPSLTGDSAEQTRCHSPQMQNQRLRRLYDVIIDPAADLIQGEEIIVVPEGPLWLTPFAALMVSNTKYLCESFRIRVIPSLTSLRLILDCPADYHSKTGALLVGDPWVQEVTSYNLCQLPFARKEVKKIGEILHTLPLTKVITGTDATKDEVLKQLSSVALVHIAAHGNMETGEIALAPNPTRLSRKPEDKDFLLTMNDVLNVKLRAKLVVLSCCHSGRGEIKAEGVVGIARAFMGAGARSVLVSLWAIDDEATLEFMTSFYQYLVEGASASESLNRAMKHMRESDKFSEVKYWAPFVLIGDNVTLELAGTN